jgi:hypothetical protein
MRKALKITIVLVLLAVPSAAFAASSASQPWAINCQQLKYKPTRITLSCGDGGTWLGKMKWSSWSNTQAVGSGNFTAIACTPDCAAGHTHSVPVKVTLSTVRTCPGQVQKSFKKAAIVYKKTRPKGAPLKINFRCPSQLPQGY